MSSFFRFLIFVALLAAAVSALYYWRAYSALQLDTGFVEHKNLPSASPTPNANGTGVGGMLTLAQLDREFQTLVERARPSVVSITAENHVRMLKNQRGPGPTFRLPPTLGSGVIVSEEGHIVTNLHVIQAAESVQVQLHDGRTLPAAMIGSDPLTDIAILKIHAGELRPSALGDSDQVRPGQIVFAVGNPYGLQETVTQGIISGIGRRSTSESVNEFFQTDTAINPGNSGGPLLNLRGEIIGINNSIGTQGEGWQGIGFSIPSNTVRRVFEDIRDHGRVLRTWFGIEWSRPVTREIADMLGLPGVYGVLIQGTKPDSPAEDAGIRAGDTIIEFNGRSIADGTDLRNRVAEAEVGQSVPVKLVRKGRIMETHVALKEFPST